MPEVELFHWNPKKSRLKRGPLSRLPLRRLPIGKPVNNFGDLLGPLIAAAVVNEKLGPSAKAARNARLLSVGSVMHFAQDGDVVWGTGVNGKRIPEWTTLPKLDVRAVRGPRTRQWLIEAGYDVGEVFGDPGLLVSRYWPEYRSPTPEHDVTVVPNLNDLNEFRSEDVLNPCGPLEEVLRQIASSQLVVASSLHGLVVADAYGVPARALVPGVETAFKYQDYYEGTGRAYEPANSVAEAIEMGGGEPLGKWNAKDLLDAFPLDLWDSGVH